MSPHRWLVPTTGSNWSAQLLISYDSNDSDDFDDSVDSDDSDDSDGFDDFDDKNQMLRGDPDQIPSPLNTD